MVSHAGVTAMQVTKRAALSLNSMEPVSSWGCHEDATRKWVPWNSSFSRDNDAKHDSRSLTQPQHFNVNTWCSTADSATCEFKLDKRSRVTHEPREVYTRHEHTEHQQTSTTRHTSSGAEMPATSSHTASLHTHTHTHNTQMFSAGRRPVVVWHVNHPQNCKWTKTQLRLFSVLVYFEFFF